MKKFLCILIVILLLAGCEKTISKDNKKTIPDFTGFKTGVYTEINDIKIMGSATYSELDGLILTLTSPESLKGMELICKDGECKVDFQELSFLISYEYLPFNAMCVSLMACAENAKTATYENGYYIFRTADSTCQLYVDGETGCFQKLVSNDENILGFENFRYLG